MTNQQSKSQALLLQADQKLKQGEDEKRALLQKVESLKASAAEMTKELIEATSAQSQAKLDLKGLTAQLREKQLRLSEAEAALLAQAETTKTSKEELTARLQEQKVQFSKATD